MTRETIQSYLQAHPEKKHRKHIPEIVSELTGVSLDQVTEVKTAIRRLQEEIPNDEKGAELEKEWRAERGMQSQSELAVININGVQYRVR